MEIFSPVDGTIVAINNETKLDGKNVKYMEISVRVSNESKKFLSHTFSSNVVSPMNGRIDDIRVLSNTQYIYISGIVMSIDSKNTLTLTKNKGDSISVGNVIGVASEDFKIRIYYLNDITDFNIGDILKIGEKI